MNDFSNNHFVFSSIRWKHKLKLGSWPMWKSSLRLRIPCFFESQKCGAEIARII